MAQNVRTYGTINGFTLTLVRAPVPAPAQVGAPPVSRVGLYLVNGADQRFVADFPDLPDGTYAAAQCATAIMTTATVLGLTVALGG